jgi:hypothetical protein
MLGITMRLISGALIALALCACSKDDKKDEAKPADTRAADTRPADTAAPATPPAAAAGTLKCDKVLPASVRDKHFAGWTVTESGGQGSVNCAMMKESNIASALYACPGWSEGTFQATMDNGKKALENAKDVAVGRMGYIGETHGMKVLQFWDDDTNCYVTVTGNGVEDLEGVGKDLAAGLTPAGVGG